VFKPTTNTENNDDGDDVCLDGLLEITIISLFCHARPYDVGNSQHYNNDDGKSENLYYLRLHRSTKADRLCNERRTQPWGIELCVALTLQFVTKKILMQIRQSETFLGSLKFTVYFANLPFVSSHCWCNNFNTLFSVLPKRKN
jgi:hypothetical protein